jgi:hypothetical protein
MSYKSNQFNNAKRFKENMKDEEEIRYFVTLNGERFPHFFKKTQLNLFENIRKDALDYFSFPQKELSWHIDSAENNPETIPEGNMLSSQISCVNHLFLLRKNHKYASTILRNIDERIISAEIVRDGYGDDGYVEFESWGTKKSHNPLQEKEQGILQNGKKWKRQRGAFSTSIDAVMVGKKNDEKSILVLIEWKYTEPLFQGKLIKTSNSIKYNELLKDKECPIHKIDNLDDLYYEPIYQLMRQTLWAWKMIKEFGCDEYIHLHIIPNENLKFQEVTSPNLKQRGKNNSDVWRNLLVEPLRYKVLSPEELMSPLRDNEENLFDYLKNRYLEKYI